MILFLGAGDLALACASELAGDFTLVRRNPRDALFATTWARVDLRDQPALSALLRAQRPDLVVFCAAPAERGERAYLETYLHPLQTALALRSAENLDFRVLFCASTAVYAEDDGQAVTESDTREPSAFNGRILRSCEALLQSRDISLRLSGLYRPRLDYSSDASFAHSLRQPAPVSLRLSQIAPDAFSNRIHLWDASRALLHVAAALPASSAQPTIVNVSDTHAASGAELQAWLRGETEFVLPHPMRGKRVNVEKLSQSDFVWRFPSFKQGYQRPDSSLPC